MSGPFRTERLVCYQGVDFAASYAFFFSPESGSTDPQDMAPLDLTGAAVRMHVRASKDPTSTALFSLSTGGSGIALISETFSPGPALPTAPNGFSVRITRDQSLAANGGVPQRNAYFDAMADMPSGETILLVCGAFDLLPTVTR